MRGCNDAGQEQATALRDPGPAPDGEQLPRLIILLNLFNIRWGD
jgi:hypothetical protein